MIIQESIIVGDRELRRTYSDCNKMIIQVETGSEYTEAIDVLDATFTYIESDTEIKIEQQELEDYE